MVSRVWRLTTFLCTHCCRGLGIYDAGVGLTLLVAADWLASAFGVPPARPRDFFGSQRDLSALDWDRLLLAVARSGRSARLLWVMGPALKGAGATLFVIDYLVRHSPASFLLFAASDGTLRGGASRWRHSSHQKIDRHACRDDGDAGACRRAVAPDLVRDHDEACEHEKRRRPGIAKRGERPVRVGSRRRKTKSAATATPENSTTANPV